MYLKKWFGYQMINNEEIQASDMAKINKYIAEFHFK